MKTDRGLPPGIDMVQCSDVFDAVESDPHGNLELNSWQVDICHHFCAGMFNLLYEVVNNV